MRKRAYSVEEGRVKKDGIHFKPSLSENDIKKTLIHELQHMVQEIEDFARGSNVDIAYRHLFAETYREMADRNAFSNMTGYEEKVQAVEDEIVAKYGMANETAAEALERIVGETYMSVVGEQEAVNTERRMDMNRVERKKQAPHMADSGLILNAKDVRKEFIRAHMDLGWNGVDRRSAPTYNLVRKGWFGVNDQGISRAVPQGETGKSSRLGSRLGRNQTEIGAEYSDYNDSGTRRGTPEVTEPEYDGQVGGTSGGTEETRDSGSLPRGLERGMGRGLGPQRTGNDSTGGSAQADRSGTETSARNSNINPKASDDSGAFSLPEKRYSLSDGEYADTFYSHMGKVIDEMKMPRLGAANGINYLKGRGVKDEEIKWSGIEEFFADKKSVSKEELQEFVRNNQLQIEETALSYGPSYTQKDRETLEQADKDFTETVEKINSLWETLFGERMYPFMASSCHILW